jgi:hypothetical protein
VILKLTTTPTTFVLFPKVYWSTTLNQLQNRLRRRAKFLARRINLKNAKEKQKGRREVLVRERRAKIYESGE